MFAEIDSSVKFMNRKNLNVGGEWLGEVPKLAICKNIEERDYRLVHCDNDWNHLCGVETRESIQEIKDVAEKHYNGINSKWIETNFHESSAKDIIEKELEKTLCSFCDKNPYGADEPLQMFVGKKAQICSKCVQQIQSN